MCKLFIVSGPLTKKQVQSILIETRNRFHTEKDGFGFVALSSNGSIARGRYFNPESFAGFDTNLPDWLCGEQSEDGKLAERTVALVIHGRTSTNMRKLRNVHPFNYKGHYLAHNGCVTWNGSKELEPRQTCDSDQFLHWLIDSGLDWDKAKTSWGGWGAIGLIQSDTGRLTVVRSGADLHIARRVNGKGWVMATKSEHIAPIMAAAGLSIDTSPLKFPDNQIVVFRGETVVSARKWEGFGTRAWADQDWTAWGGYKGHYKGEYTGKVYSAGSTGKGNGKGSKRGNGRKHGKASTADIVPMSCPLDIVDAQEIPSVDPVRPALDLPTNKELFPDYTPPETTGEDVWNVS